MNFEEITSKARIEVGLLEGIYKPYNPADQWKLIVKRALEIQGEEIFADLDTHIQWTDDESFDDTDSMIDCLFIKNDYRKLKKKYGISSESVQEASHE